MFEARPRTTATITLLPAPVVLDDDRHIHPDQGAYVGCLHSVAGPHQHDIVDADDTRDDLLDPVVDRAGSRVDAAQQVESIRIVQRHEWVHRLVVLRPSLRFCGSHLSVLAGSRYGRRSFRSLHQSRQDELV